MSESTYVTASGRVYVIMKMWTPASWATYERKPNGNYRRLVSPRLPTRATYEEALADFRSWIELQTGWFTGTGKSRHEYGPIAEALAKEVHS